MAGLVPAIPAGLEEAVDVRDKRGHGGCEAAQAK
jgi:hypothetical protein